MWINQIKQFFCGKLKLFTLKHSRFFAGFALKYSRISAETLPHSIYTYSYIYKKTNSCLVKSVNNGNYLSSASRFCVANSNFNNQ